ncbi:hypothetical protein M9978_00225 [Sphingomonas sp. MG17]|jgi:hypothetical protein|uniref:Uncharacterized protein n=1 Tax=Sphingomonas tagetis TaxID=2949092 RepID=A0A9X2HDI6_9SPHN|nr:hypothetical protein [Sphingomonas tagetis]MCP3728843.1 hypothetical protein [Sphingomonas tagetis]
MKSFAVMICILVAGDLALFSGAYTQQAWHSTRGQLKSIQVLADDATGSLVRS